MRKPLENEFWRHRNKMISLLIKDEDARFTWNDARRALAEYSTKLALAGCMYCCDYDGNGKFTKYGGQSEWDLINYIGNMAGDNMPEDDWSE